MKKGEKKLKFFYEDKGRTVRAEYGNGLEFGAHLHNHLELVYMIEGRSHVVVDSQEYVVEAGDALLVFPNQIHQYRNIDKEYYIVMIFPPEICSDFSTIFSHYVPASPLLVKAEKNPYILQGMKRIVEECENPSVYHESWLHGAFLTLLSELFTQIDFVKVNSSDGNTLRAILNYCSGNYCGDMKLESVAKALHMNKYYVSHLFSDKLSIGFSEYINMLRVSEACQLLSKQTGSITEISYQVGFNSTRSFNRVFLKYTGQTPKQYRTGQEIDCYKRENIEHVKAQEG